MRVSAPELLATHVSHKTGRRYTALLKQVFLVATLQPWFTNALQRIAKTPKMHFLDSGLLATTRGLTSGRLKADRAAFGALLESFVFFEIVKLMTASSLQLTPWHFRDQQMREVDIVLERDDGMIAGIEIKASATVRPGDPAASLAHHPAPASKSNVPNAPDSDLPHFVRGLDAATLATALLDLAEEHDVVRESLLRL